MHQCEDTSLGRVLLQRFDDGSKGVQVLGALAIGLEFSGLDIENVDQDPDAREDFLSFPVFATS